MFGGNGLKGGGGIPASAPTIGRRGTGDRPREDARFRRNHDLSLRGPSIWMELD